jgi:hypothetical protein
MKAKTETSFEKEPFWFKAKKKNPIAFTVGL